MWSLARAALPRLCPGSARARARAPARAPGPAPGDTNLFGRLNLFAYEKNVRRRAVNGAPPHIFTLGAQISRRVGGRGTSAGGRTATSCQSDTRIFTPRPATSPAAHALPPAHPLAPQPAPAGAEGPL
jgi:hypothetical protein